MLVLQTTVSHTKQILMFRVIWVHSTETAMLKVSSDILTALDQGDLALLSLLDLTSAFDTVDHDILSRRLETSFGLQSKFLERFSSFTKNRRQSIHHSTSHTPAVRATYHLRRATRISPRPHSLCTIHRRSPSASTQPRSPTSCLH